MRAAFQIRPVDGAITPRPAHALGAAAPVLGLAVASRYETSRDGIVPRFADSALAGHRHQATVALPDRADRALRIDDKDSGLSVKAEGGAVTIQSLTVYPLKSAWPDDVKK